MQIMIRWVIAATQGRNPLLDNRIIGSLRTVRRNLPLPAVAVSSRGFVPARSSVGMTVGLAACAMA